VTSVSGVEEWFIETFVMGARAQTRGIGAALRAAGFRYASAFPGRAHAVRDCNLVSSQNPFSGAPFERLLLDALADWRRSASCVPQSATTADGR
jgi:putative intracellular protease/amidase